MVFRGLPATSQADDTAGTNRGMPEAAIDQARQKLGNDADDPHYMGTVNRFGYCLRELA